MNSTCSILRRAAHVTASLAFGGVMAASFPLNAFAEADEVRFAYQPGLLYLPDQVVLSQKFVEKHAMKAGLGDVKVTSTRLSGGAVVNDALLSGSVDFVTGGIAPLLKIWDRTKGGNEVKAVISVSNMAVKFVTNDPRVKSIKDYAGITDHRIGIPAIKTSFQATALQMAAEKAFGPDGINKLDALTVSVPHPQAVASLFSGKSEIKSHGSTLPFTYQELKAKDKNIRLVFSSYDINGPHTTVALYAARKWKEQNPKLFKAVFDAYVEAHQWINADLKRAAKLFKDFTNSPLDLADLEAMVSDKSELQYSMSPMGTMKFAEFMHRTGSLNNKPTSWKDYYWDVSHGLSGD